MAADGLVLDPAEVATSRTEFDLYPYVRADSLDFGDAELQAYMAEQAVGSSPVDGRLPNRTITIPLRLSAGTTDTFDVVRQKLQAKVALFQREGGWLKRATAAGTFFADVVNATLHMPESWLGVHRQVDIEGQLVLECLPDFYGAEDGNLFDDLNSNPLFQANWTFDAGSGTLSSSGGHLIPSDTTAKRLYRSDKTVYDSQVTTKLVTGVGNPSFSVVAKRLASADSIRARLSGAALLIVKRDGGVDSTLATTAFSTSNSTAYWLRCRMEGNKVTAEVFTSNPSPQSTPAATTTATLTGADATKYGLGISGNPGLQITPVDTNEIYDDFNVEPRVYIERTNSELVAGPMYSLKGDHPGRCRIVVNELQGQDQRGLIAAWWSRNYSSAATAALAWEAEALTPLDSAATAALSGSSGGGNNTVKHSNLSTSWTPVLSTQASGGGAHLTHVGSYRVYARVYSPDGSTVSLRLLWDVGDLALPVENSPWTFPGASQFYVADLGEVRLDQVLLGSHRWQGVIQGKGTVGGEDVNIDRLWLVPIDESMVKLRAPVSADIGLASYSARDEFNQTAGALNGKTLPAGGTWAGSGDADDFAVEVTGHTAQRTAISDSDILNGRREIAGTTAFTNVVAQVDVMTSAGTNSLRQGVLARYVDANNWVFGAFEPNQLSKGEWVVWKVVAGVRTVIGRSPAGSNQINITYDAWYTVRLLVDATGRWFFWGNLKDGPAILLLAGTDLDLAIGGALASGKCGIYDTNVDASPAATRSYDNFAAWVPTTDAVLFASQSAELRTEGVFREDSTGVSSGPVPSEGDLMRVPPPGLEARPAQLFVKATRGDLDQLPDSGIDDIYAQVFFRPAWLFVPTT